MARGRGEVTGGFTVPAINIRGVSYDTARVDLPHRATRSTPARSSSRSRAPRSPTPSSARPSTSRCMIAAALREGFRGPVFIQGDHFQVNHKKFAVDPVAEVNAVKALVTEAVAAGFYNIDVDTSTLVDLSKPTLDEQQRLNYEVARRHHALRARSGAGGRDDLARRRDRRSRHGELARADELAGLHGRLQPYAGGAGAGHGRPVEDLACSRARRTAAWCCADGIDRRRRARPRDAASISREIARDDYGWRAPCSTARRTLPDGAFHNFPKTETAEIHLATNFQNMMYDHLPAALREEIYEWLRVNAKDERKADRHRRAVLLQDAQEGDRAVQAAAVGAAGRREGDARRGLRRQVHASCSRS